MDDGLWCLFLLSLAGWQCRMTMTHSTWQYITMQEQQLATHWRSHQRGTNACLLMLQPFQSTDTAAIEGNRRLNVCDCADD